ncbi:MAG: c-type cytochrome biogenesis protein CcmI [Sinobacterium sp.]|nr:c-type cytochrome biogenesis protein CcmI [Sinobacterium sp.]
MFYGILLLLVCASVVLVWRAFKPRENNHDELIQQRLQRHVALFKNNAAQLENERADGLISDADYQSLYNDQARDLIETVDHLQSSGVSSGSLKGVIAAALFFIPLFSIVLYYSKGAYPDYIITQELNVLEQAETATQYTSSLAGIKNAIEARVEQRPDNIEYRLLLAQLAMSNEEFTVALSHYSVIAELLPEDAQAQAYYAQALYLSNGRKLNAGVAAALDKTLQLDPFQVTALGLVGILAFESGDYQGAVDAWQKLMAVTNPQSPRGKMIQEGLSRAQQQLASQNTETETSSPLASTAHDATAEKGVAVALSIDESLLNSLDENYSIFVYAKAESGPPMPLAVQRLTVADLPLTVTLDDSTAMTPNFKLSKFDRIIVGARISKTGTAIAQAGDVTVELEGFNWRANSHQIIVLKP